MSNTSTPKPIPLETDQETKGEETFEIFNENDSDSN